MHLHTHRNNFQVRVEVWIETSNINVHCLYSWQRPTQWKLSRNASFCKRQQEHRGNEMRTTGTVRSQGEEIESDSDRACDRDTVNDTDRSANFKPASPFCTIVFSLVFGHTSRTQRLSKAVVGHCWVQYFKNVPVLIRTVTHPFWLSSYLN